MCGPSFASPVDYSAKPQSDIALALQRLFFQLLYFPRAVRTSELLQSFGWGSADALMQHDVQELARLLIDRIEERIRTGARETHSAPASASAGEAALAETRPKGTPDDADIIPDLFRGQLLSFIRCRDVDYESKRTECFYDISLNVDGCVNVLKSFDVYTTEEVLEGENQYRAGDLGLQDAVKGLKFLSFPKVLHLQLKRFQFDWHTERMRKVNSRYEFSLELDLTPYLDPSAPEDTPRPLFHLHAVLVHAGMISGGHYYAYICPRARSSKWFKFDDEMVTPAYLRQAIHGNFGGPSENYITPSQRQYFGAPDRMASGYILVYIRDDARDEILRPITRSEVPRGLVTALYPQLLLSRAHCLREQMAFRYTTTRICDDRMLAVNPLRFVLNTRPGLHPSTSFRQPRFGSFGGL